MKQRSRLREKGQWKLFTIWMLAIMLAVTMSVPAASFAASDTGAKTKKASQTKVGERNGSVESSEVVDSSDSVEKSKSEKSSKDSKKDKKDKKKKDKKKKDKKSKKKKDKKSKKKKDKKNKKKNKKKSKKKDKKSKKKSKKHKKSKKSKKHKKPKHANCYRIYKNKDGVVKCFHYNKKGKKSKKREKNRYFFVKFDKGSKTRGTAVKKAGESGTLYYFNKKGKGKKSTGWFKQNGHKYYFKNGKRYKGTKKVKKTWYQFSPEDGKVWWEIGDDVDKKIQSYGSNTRYLIIVKLKEHRVRVYEKTDGRWKKIHRWKCTTGKKSTPTPKGTFHIGVKGLHFNTGERSRCWYYTQFYGSYMFHSVLYDRQPRPVNCTRGTLGASLSHGCIRLKLSDAKWLQDHVPAGTKVVIY